MLATLLSLLCIAQDFEVASVRPSNPAARGMMLQITPGGGIRTVNTNLRQLITMAYQIERFQISGGPSWLETERFDIQAKPPAQDVAGPEEALARQRLRRLLEDRFQLKLREEVRQGSILALIPAKGGPKLRESTEGFEGINARPGEWVAERISMDLLARSLSSQLGRVVLNRTGLTQTFAFRLTWAPSAGNSPLANEKAGGEIPAGEGPGSDSSGPSLFQAVQDQLGLKLEAERGPVTHMVIERVSRPEAN